jgi:hypothetical protein
MPYRSLPERLALVNSFLKGLYRRVMAFLADEHMMISHLAVVKYSGISGVSPINWRRPGVYPEAMCRRLRFG